MQWDRESWGFGRAGRIQGGRTLRVGPSRLTLEPADSQSFFVLEIADFDRAEVARRLRGLGVDDVVERPNEDAVALRDPDGLPLWIRGTSERPGAGHE